MAFVIGTPCYAKWAEDNLWYQAKVIGIEVPGAVFEVVFTEYGNKQVTNVEAMRPKEKVESPRKGKSPRKSSPHKVSPRRSKPSAAAVAKGAAQVPPTAHSDGESLVLQECGDCKKALVKTYEQCRECKKPFCRTCGHMVLLTSLGEKKKRFICKACLPIVKRQMKKSKKRAVPDLPEHDAELPPGVTSEMMAVMDQINAAKEDAAKKLAVQRAKEALQRESKQRLAMMSGDLLIRPDDIDLAKEAARELRRASLQGDATTDEKSARLKAQLDHKEITQEQHAERVAVLGKKTLTLEDSVEKHSRVLKELLDSGILTQDEFNARRLATAPRQRGVTVLKIQNDKALNRMSLSKIAMIDLDFSLSDSSEDSADDDEEEEAKKQRSEEDSEEESASDENRIDSDSDSIEKEWRALQLLKDRARRANMYVSKASPSPAGLGLSQRIINTLSDSPKPARNK